MTLLTIRIMWVVEWMLDLIVYLLIEVDNIQPLRLFFSAPKTVYESLLILEELAWLSYIIIIIWKTYLYGLLGKAYASWSTIE